MNIKYKNILLLVAFVLAIVLHANALPNDADQQKLNANNQTLLRLLGYHPELGVVPGLTGGGIIGQGSPDPGKQIVTKYEPIRQDLFPQTSNNQTGRLFGNPESGVVPGLTGGGIIGRGGSLDPGKPIITQISRPREVSFPQQTNNHTGRVFGFPPGTSYVPGLTNCGLFRG